MTRMARRLLSISPSTHWSPDRRGQFRQVRRHLPSDPDCASATSAATSSATRTPAFLRSCQLELEGAGPRLGFAYRALDGKKSFVIRAATGCPIPDEASGMDPRAVRFGTGRSSFSEHRQQHGSLADGYQTMGCAPCHSILPASTRPIPSLTRPTRVCWRAVFPSSRCAIHSQRWRVQDWNLTLEKEVMSDTVARVGYIGNYGASSSRRSGITMPPQRTSGTRPPIHRCQLVSSPQ